jgi:NitT/TauT family transport system substrate-binding protein
LLFNGGADAVSATTYNEYKLILDAGAKPEDLTMIDFNQEGTAMLEDGIFANEVWLRDPKNKAAAARFLRASLQGWRYCRDFPNECVDIVLRNASGSDREHQSWMMAEINKLIWGPPAPPVELGFMDPGAFERTASIALRFGVIHQPPDRGSYTHEIWKLAVR